MPRGPDISFGSADHRNGVKYKYGLTVQQYQAMFRTQNGECAICHRKIRNGKGVPAKDQACVDHNHVTDKVRALLCKKCNSGLGMFKDRIELLKRAMAYLEYHSE